MSSSSFGETGDVHPIAVPTAMLAILAVKVFFVAVNEFIFLKNLLLPSTAVRKSFALLPSPILYSLNLVVPEA